MKQVMELPLMMLLLMPLLGSFCIVATANDATAATRRPKYATETKAATEAFVHSSSSSRGLRSRGVAQYRLPLEGTAATAALETKDSGTRVQSMRRRTQVAMRRRPSSTATTTSSTTTSSTTTSTTTTTSKLSCINWTLAHVHMTAAEASDLSQTQTLALT